MMLSYVVIAGWGGQTFVPRVAGDIRKSLAGRIWQKKNKFTKY